MKEVTVQCSLIPAVVYAAKSTQDRHKSIPTQLEDCRRMAAENDWEVVGEYQDEGFSAYSKSRGPGLAEAREHAARAAAECGETVMLIAQHSDRFSRGAGDKPGAPAALVEIWHAERRRDVHLRSVQDDFDLRTSAAVANMGERNYSDSKRKALATAAGRKRQAERGEAPGSVPDGYIVEHAKTAERRVVIDPERRHIYELIWRLALAGVTVRQIVRELAALGHMTAPRKAKPRPFDAVRVGKVLNCATYAGLVVHCGQIVGEGSWEPFVSPSDWHRLRRERSERARHRSEPVGRPAGGLLARLARCECGAAMVQQHGGPRKDGSRKRTYTCTVHMHGAGACAAPPYDAQVVERTVLGGLDELLGQAGVWSKALLAGRDAQRGRLTAEAEAAAAEVAACESATEQLVARYDTAVVASDDVEVELAKGAMAQRKQAARRAAIRHQAATDALATEETQPGEDAEEALARLYEALSAGLHAAGEDVRALNIVLREHFQAMHLALGEDGQLSITPVLSTTAVEDLRRENEIATRRTSGDPIAWQHWSYDRDPADPEHFILMPEAPVLTGADRPGKQRPSHLPHNTRRGSWRGTAGGGPRRSTAGGRRRSGRSRS
jgi:site-specific DNA recombinase